jgi:signal transduction histidine kinase
LWTQHGASEIYLDGKLISVLGKVSTSPESEDNIKYGLKNPEIIPILLNKKSEHVLAVRFSNYWDQNQSSILIDNQEEFPWFFARLIETKKGIQYKVNRARIFMVNKMLFCVPLAFAILHFFMFLFFWDRKGNLYYSLFAASIAILIYAPIHAGEITNFKSQWYYSQLSEAASILTMLFSIRFLHYEILGHTPKLYRWLVAICTIMIIFCWMIPLAYIYIFYAAVLFPEVLRVTIKGIRRKVYGAWLLAIGWIIFIAGCGIQILEELYILSIGMYLGPYPYLYGTVGLVIAMSIYLARSFSQTNRELSIQLNQVKMQHEKLIQADKMASVGILVSGIAHEINNPNNYIQLNSNNLSDVWYDLKPKLDEYAKKNGDFIVAGLPYSTLQEDVGKLINGVSEGSHRIKTIVESLKDFARKDSGHMDEQVDVNSVIKSAIIILHNLIKNSTNSFTTELSGHLPILTGNRQQIEQVIINLLSNACQALENRDKAISIKTSVDKLHHKILITVQDEGAGISDESLIYIMDPFFTTKRDTGGTGLGLSISYNIVKEHSGEIDVKSEVGKGTTFTLKLPYQKNDAYLCNS